MLCISIAILSGSKEENTICGKCFFANSAIYPVLVIITGIPCDILSVTELPIPSHTDVCIYNCQLFIIDLNSSLDFTPKKIMFESTPRNFIRCWY